MLTSILCWEWTQGINIGDNSVKDCHRDHSSCQLDTHQSKTSLTVTPPLLTVRYQCPFLGTCQFTAGKFDAWIALYIQNTCATKALGHQVVSLVRSNSNLPSCASIWAQYGSKCGGFNEVLCLLSYYQAVCPMQMHAGSQLCCWICHLPPRQFVLPTQQRSLNCSSTLWTDYNYWNLVAIRCHFWSDCTVLTNDWR